MNEKKFLYYINPYHGLQRAEILRETDCFFFVESGRSVTKVNKKTLRSKSHLYREESPGLIKSYTKEFEYRKLHCSFICRIEMLKNTNDEATMKKVLEIEVPK